MGLNKKDKRVLFELIGTTTICGCVIAIVCIGTKGFTNSNKLEESSEIETSYDYNLAKDNIANLARYRLNIDGRSDSDFGGIISLSYKDNELYVTGEINTPSGFMLQQLKVKYQDNVSMDEAIYQLGDKDDTFIPSKWDSTTTYLLEEDTDNFLNNSQFKTDFISELSHKYVGMIDESLNQRYFFTTYKDDKQIISINGLEFDKASYEYNKLTAPITNISINDAPNTFKLLYSIL